MMDKAENRHFEVGKRRQVQAEEFRIMLANMEELSKGGVEENLDRLRRLNPAMRLIQCDICGVRDFLTVHQAKKEGWTDDGTFKFCPKCQNEK